MNKRARLNYIHALSNNVERKKMYKAKKQWVVAGISFLVATGMGAIGGQLTTHAASTNVSQQATTSTAPKLASGSSNNVNQNSSTTNSTNSSANLDVKQLASSNGIQHRAEALHSQVVTNGMNALNKIKNTPVNNSGSSSASKVNNKASGNKTVSLSSANVKSSVSANASVNIKHGFGAMRLNTQAQSTPQTASNWIYNSGNYISDNQVHDWQNQSSYRGLKWKYSPTYKAAEFLNGTPNTDLSQFISKNNYLKNIKSIKFDSDIHTNNVVDMNNMLSNDSNLHSIILSRNFNAPKVQNMYGMFCNDAIQNLDLSSLNTTTALTSTSWMFEGDSNLKSLKLSNSFDTSKVTDMSFMFDADSSLTSLNLPQSFTTGNVQNMEWMFNRLGASTLSLPTFNTNNVQDMSDMFGGAKFTTLNLPSTFNAPKVSNTGSMFSGLNNLQNLDISMLNTTNKLTNINNMFGEDPALKSVKFSNDFDTSKVSDMHWLFDGDYALKSINFPSSFKTNNVKNMQWMFKSDKSLTSLSLPTFNTNNVENMSGMFTTDSDLKTLNLPSTFNAPKVQTMNGMFSLDTNLNNLDISMLNTTSDLKETESMFYGDHSITAINFPDTFNTSQVTNMSNMFQYDFNLQTLELPNSFNTQNVSDMSNMFCADHLLQNFSLGPNFDTSKVKDMSSMFSDIFYISTFNLGSKFNTSRVSNMAHMFDSDYRLTHLTLPYNFDTSNVSDMYDMFINDATQNNGMKLTLSKSFNTNKAMNTNNTGDGNKYNGLQNMFCNTRVNSLTVPQGANFEVNNQAGLKPLYQKDSNDSFTLNTPYDFTKGNNIGVFENKNTPNVQDTIAFYNQSNNNLISKTTINGNANTSYKLASNSSLIPKGYHLVDNYGNSINSDTFTINPNVFDNVEIKSNNPSTNTQANKDIPVAPTMVNDAITYSYKNKQGQAKTITTKTINGQTGTSAKNDVDSSKNMPTGYQPSGNSDAFDYPDKNSSKTINIKPITKSETITYMNGDQKVVSDTVSGNDSSAQNASDTTFDANSKMPNGYKLSQNQPKGLNPNKINYDGSPHIVNVVIDATKQTANIHYKLPNGQVINDTISGKNGSDVTPTAPQGYHFTGNPKKYHFDPKNAGNEPSDNNSDANDLNIAPNTVKGTATINIVYHINGVKSDINGTPQKVSINGQYGDSDQMIYPVQYQPSNDDYNTTSNPLDINFNDIAKNGSNDNYNPLTTFTYNATEAPNLVIRYDDTTNHNNVVHSDTYTPSDIGIKPQDWVLGNTITLGTGNQGTPTNKGTNVINAPYGYHLEDNKSGFDYKNGQESITLEPNAQVGGHPVVLMTMPTGNVAPNNNQSNNKPASNASNSSSAASISMNSNELSSLAKEIGGDINVTVRPNVTNTTNTIDDTTLNSLASEVATNNQEISSLANKPTNTTNNVNYSYFDNLVNNGVDRLTKAIDKDFKANLTNARAQRVHKTTVKRVRKHIKWIMIMKPVKLYNKATLVGTKSEVKTLRPNHEITLNVKDVYKVHNQYVFKVNFRNHNYFITANNNYVRNSYLPLDCKVINRKVRVLNDVYGYRHKNHDVAKTYHKGFVGRVKNIVKLGHYNMTRIQLTNGLWISANKNFIKLI